MPTPYHDDHQPADQLIAILFTLASAITSGLIVGWILTFIRPDENISEFYCDEPYWEILDDFGRSIVQHKTRMEAGLKKIQSGVAASHLLTDIVEKYDPTPNAGNDVSETTFFASLASSVHMKKGSAPRKEKGGNLDSSVHSKNSVSSRNV
jgi:hypothetical protein